MIRIMIIDDHIQTSHSTRKILEKELDFEIIAEADTLFEAEVLTAKAQPDVILLDPHIAGSNGFEVLEQIRAYYRAPVLSFSLHCSTNNIFAQH